VLDFSEARRLFPPPLVSDRSGGGPESAVFFGAAIVKSEARREVLGGAGDTASGITRRRRGETRVKPKTSKTQHYWPDVVGLQVINHAKTGQYGPSSYCAQKVEIEILLRV